MIAVGMGLVLMLLSIAAGYFLKLLKALMVCALMAAVPLLVMYFAFNEGMGQYIILYGAVFVYPCLVGWLAAGAFAGGAFREKNNTKGAILIVVQLVLIGLLFVPALMGT